MISKVIDLIQVPNQRLFSTGAAAKYLGVHPDTLRKYADLGRIKARKLEKRRVFALEDLDTFINSLPCYDGLGGKPGLERRRNGS
ncbi:helix-turn-helix domain-containing protein [Acidobacteria bacterium AH-259-L09]|nr:helix-turn-helix domain-containing protein [Acidobacteria bacterium AH-259-L09]